MKRSMHVVLIVALLLVTLYTAISIVTINSEAKEVASATDAAEDLNAINIVTDMRFNKTNKRSWDSITYDPTKLPQIFETTRAMAHRAVITDAEALEPEPEPEPEPKMYYYGCMEMTAYIATGNCTADGSWPQSGYTVACNNSDLWHKWIYIEGYGDRYVCDTGGMGYGVLDLFVDSYGEAINIGRRNVNVYVYE